MKQHPTVPLKEEKPKKRNSLNLEVGKKSKIVSVEYFYGSKLKECRHCKLRQQTKEPALPASTRRCNYRAMQTS